MASTFVVQRSAEIAAPAGVLHGLVDDFRQWTRWSPWEGLDENLRREYSGPDHGVGAGYSWQGNRKAGAGRMEIVASTPEQIDLHLEFTRPFKAVNPTSFRFEPIEGGTRVTWTMTGTQHLMMRLFSVVMPMDKMVGGDFERGLAGLDRAAHEAG